MKKNRMFFGRIRGAHSSSELLLVLGVVVGCLMNQTETSWAAGKKAISSDAAQLSVTKFQKRAEELRLPSDAAGLDSQGPSDSEGREKKASTESPYDRHIRAIRDGLKAAPSGDQTQKSPESLQNTSIEEAKQVFTTPAHSVYQASLNFISKVYGCSPDQMNWDPADHPLEAQQLKKKQFQSLLDAVDELTSVQEALKEEMGTHSVKSGSKELRKQQDTNLIGNLPHPKFRVTRADGSVLSVLRMGSQTVDLPNKEGLKAQVVPEFEAYIQSLKSQDKQHVYVNLQMTVKPGPVFGLLGGGFGDYSRENERAQALHQFAQGKNELVVISLDKNSHFYQFFPPTGKRNKVIHGLAQRFFPDFDDPKQIQEHQRKTGINLSDLWTKPTGNCLSAYLGKSCREKIKKEFIQDMETLVHDIYGDTPLSRDRSKSVMDLAYQYLIDRASQKAQSMNISCKSGVDRAGGVNANLYLASLMKDICEGKEKTEIAEKIKSLKYTIFSDAVLYNGRPINDDRLGRFQKSARLMLEGVRAQLDQGRCMNQSKDKLFSGSGLVNEFDYDGQDEKACMTTQSVGNCSAPADSFGSIERFSRWLKKVGEKVGLSHSSRKKVKGDRLPLLPLSEGDEDGEED